MSSARSATDDRLACAGRSIWAAGRELGNYWRASPEARAKIRRRCFFDLAGAFTPVLVADSPFGRLFVSTTDREIGRRVFVEGSYETGLFRRTIDFLGRVSGLGDLSGRAVLEIGANIGTTSLLFARANAGRVYAYEPVPSNFALLRSMVAANALEDVIEIRAAAVSDRIGSAVMELSPINSGDHRLRVPGAVEPPLFDENTRATIDVAVTTVDEEVRSGRLPLSEVALAWIDVQGHEGGVLAGAGTLLESGIPVVVEYWPYGLRRAGGLSDFERLVARNYNAFLDTGRDTAAPRLQPATAVSELASRYTDPEAYTDLVLIP